MAVGRAEHSKGTSTTGDITQQAPSPEGTTDRLVGRGKQLWGEGWKVFEGMATRASEWRRHTRLFHGSRRVAAGDSPSKRLPDGIADPNQESPKQGSKSRLFKKFYWKYVPFLALLGTIIMFAGLVVFSIAAVQSGQTAREIVDLVQGGASGFSWIVGAYKTTVTVTVAVTVFTIAACMCVYGVRADQRLRQDLKYGQGERQRKAYAISQGVATALLILIFILATWFVLLVALNVSATVAMITLSQGAAAATVILNTAVAVAQNSVQAAENALGLHNYSLGNYTTLFGNSTAGLVADSLAAGQQLLDIAGAQNGTLGQAARGAREVLVSSMGPQSRMASPSSDSSALSSTLTAAAQQMMNAARVTNSTMTRLEQSLAPTTQGLLSAALNGSLSQQIQELGRSSSSSAPGPQQALQQADSLSSLRQSLTSLSSAFDNFWTGPPNPPQQPRPEPRHEPGRQPDQPGQLAASNQPQLAGAGNQPQPQPQPQPAGGAGNPVGAGAALGGGGRRLRQQDPPPRPVTAADYANSSIGGLLNTLMPTQENLLQLAGAATHVVAELQRVAGAPEDQTGPIGFGTGTSVCPSLVCLDVKLYSFLNSAACICNAQQLQQVHDLGEVARDRFRNAVIGVVLLYFGTSILLARLAAEVAMIARDKNLLFSSKYDSYHERQKARLAALATSGDPATLPTANPLFSQCSSQSFRSNPGARANSLKDVTPASIQGAEPMPASKAEPTSGKPPRETELSIV